MKQILKKIIIFLLEWEAKLVLRKYKPRIIGVTGSVGKTSTKDAVYSVLAPSFHVRKSEKSFNSEIGIPLTILGVPNGWSNFFQWLKNLFEGAALILLSSDYPRVLVLEVGADRPGDIEHVSSWLKPNTVLLTRFPDVPVHVEFFNSPEHLIEEKMHLVQALSKVGTLVLNFDDERMRTVGPPIEGSIITYGLMEGADVRATSVAYMYEKNVVVGISFNAKYRESDVTVHLWGTLGEQQVYPALASLALGISEGLNLKSMKDALEDHTSPPGRMRLIRGINNSTIIDDTYNSSPIAVGEALKALSGVKTQGKKEARKIAVLGDMMELGNHSIPAHKKVGELVAEKADIFIAVGIRSHYSVEQAQKKKMKKRDIFSFNEAEEAARFLKNTIEEGDVVLVKGSQSMRMERTVEAIMEKPEEAKELLVRQDPMWLKR